MNPKVYLAGPITGLSYGETTDWRELAKRELALACIDGISPMRGKDYLLADTTFATVVRQLPLDLKAKTLAAV